MALTPEPSNGRATIREVYNLLGQVNTNLEGQIKEVRDAVQEQAISIARLEEQQKTDTRQAKQVSRAQGAWMTRRWQIVTVCVAFSSMLVSAVLKFVS